VPGKGADALAFPTPSLSEEVRIKERLVRIKKGLELVC
jgi:hypothetical protein